MSDDNKQTDNAQAAAEDAAKSEEKAETAADQAKESAGEAKEAAKDVKAEVKEVKKEDKKENLSEVIKNEIAEAFKNFVEPTPTKSNKTNSANDPTWKKHLDNFQNFIK